MVTTTSCHALSSLRLIQCNQITLTLVFVRAKKKLISRLTIKSRVLAEIEGGRESEPERMSGRERERVGGIMREERMGGGLTYPTRVMLAEVFVSAAIFSLAPLPACYPNLGYQDHTLTHPSMSECR